jgi:MFS family permease
MTTTTSARPASPRQMTISAFVTFAAFGAFWGVWGASVPQIKLQAGVSDGQLGFALFFVGAGGLPAMLLEGRALDRFGMRGAGWLTGALGVVGAGMALTATDLPRLCIGLTVVGAVSGAADVANNAIAGRAEQLSGRPVITRAHGAFSSLVVLASLATGLASAASLPLAVPFVAVTALSVLAGISLHKAVPVGAVPHHHSRLATSSAASDSSRRIVPFILIGALGALAFASENAHQSWSAVFAHDELGSGNGLSAVAPAVFATTVAITRFATGGLEAAHARTVVLAGASAAAAGALLIAGAPTLLIAGLGLAVAAIGTAVLYPTLIGVVSRSVAEHRRGRATSIVTTVSYLGFVLGPVYVGVWADAAGLRGAMLAVAALALVLVALAPPLLRISGLDEPTPTRGPAATRRSLSARRARPAGTIDPTA